MRSSTVLASVVLLALAAAPATGQSFVNWETPHVHPLDLTPDGNRLLSVNTADNRLEVWDVSGGALVPLTSIPVGLDPVTVRARSNTEAWVVNLVSDSVSVVDLTTSRVRATLDTDDEPCDVVFAGSPERAFVSCSQTDTVLVFDPGSLSTAPTSLAIEGETPRAMATDGDTVWVAIFESGNNTTILGGGGTIGGGFPPNVVSDPLGPYGGVNPPPNDGASFDPPQNGANPAPPAVGLIVRKNGAGQWMDDNGGNWTSLVSGANAALSGRPVGWDMLDNDIAVIDANTLAMSYVENLMNIGMAIGFNDGTDEVTLVGTDATNEIRFEPVINGTFLRVNVAIHDPAGPSSSVLDLNTHLTYASSTVAQNLRDESIGDPRGIVWNAAGTRGYVTGMGSNNVVVIDGNGARAGLAPTIEVGEGPTGVVLDEGNNRLFVLNKFEAAVSVIDTGTELETDRVSFYDPSPAAIKVGRKHLYDTHKNSGLGHVACGSCHVDARMDRLAWDLGDPAGAMKSTSGQNQGGGLPIGNFPDWHPMKGPMTTQTLQDIIGKEPHHWRGDRDGIEEFNGAFLGLQGDDANLTAGEMQEYEDFLATIHFPPNPFRNFDNSLPTNLPLPGHFTPGVFGPAGLPLPNGDAQNGLALYRPPNLLDAVACVTCHTLPTGLGPDFELSGLVFTPIPPGPNGERHHALVNVDGSTNVSLKVPHLRNQYQKVGMELTQSVARTGFGFIHDGAVDSLARFVTEPVFATGSVQDTADLVAFMLAFGGSDLPQGSPTNLLEPPGTPSQDAHAAVGAQTTLVDAGSPAPGQLTLISDMLTLADAGDVGVVVKGRQGGLARGYSYLGGGTFQSDRLSETVAAATLQAGASPGNELTYTVVPLGSQTRIGVDRDEDGFFDRDELDAGSDPADPTSTPGSCNTAAGTDLGFGKAGTGGLVPELRACGELSTGSTADLILTDASPLTPAYLIIGVSAIFAPYSAGTLVPSPDLVLGPVNTDGTGGIVIGDLDGGGGPFDLYMQWVILDPGAVFGKSMSNGVEVHFLP